MVPPHVDKLLPAEGATFTHGVITLQGSLLGMLFERTPPSVVDIDTGQSIPVTWTEEVTDEWYAEEPCVGGDVQTRITLTLASYTPGKHYRLRYAHSLHASTEAILRAE